MKNKDIQIIQNVKLYWVAQDIKNLKTELVTFL